MGWNSVFIDPAKQMLIQIGNFLTTLLSILFILLIGWFIAKLIKNLVTRLLQVIPLDKIADQADISKLLAKGGVNLALSEIIGLLCYWVAMLIVVVIAINSLGLEVAAELLNRIVLYIPNVIISIFILVLGMFLANLVSTIVKTASSNAGIEQAKLLAKIVEIVVMVFAIAISLEQLQIGVEIVRLFITVILASLGLGLGLAIGLGCKDIVKEAVADFLDKIKPRR